MHWGDSVFEVRGGLRAISVGLCLLRRLIGSLRIRGGVSLICLEICRGFV